MDDQVTSGPGGATITNTDAYGMPQARPIEQMAFVQPPTITPPTLTPAVGEGGDGNGCCPEPQCGLFEICCNLCEGAGNS